MAVGAATSGRGRTNTESVENDVASALAIKLSYAALVSLAATGAVRPHVAASSGLEAVALNQRVMANSPPTPVSTTTGLRPTLMGPITASS